MIGFWAHRTNLHKHPWISRIMCWMGRHDYKIVRSMGETSALLECFYCEQQRHSSNNSNITAARRQETKENRS